MHRFRDAPMTGSRYWLNRMPPPAPRYLGRVKRLLRRYRPVVRSSPSHRCASWRRIWVLILGPGWQRARRGDHPRRRDAAQQRARASRHDGRARQPSAEPGEARRAPRGRADPDQGRTQVDGRCNGALGVYRTHVSVWLDCDVSATMQLVERLTARREFADLRVSPLLIIAKAVCLALGRTPELNSFWDEPAQQIVLKSSINLGIAAATPHAASWCRTSRAPSRSALAELAVAPQEVVTTAREGKTQPADMAGGTFTITNIGVLVWTPVPRFSTQGESGILCFGQISSPALGGGDGSDERIEPRWVTTLSVSFDHRLADGAQGSTFLADVGRNPQRPGPRPPLLTPHHPDLSGFSGCHSDL